MIDLQFVTASHKEDVLQNNLMKSSCIHQFPLTIQRGFDNIPDAYNAADITCQFVCYVHHDVYLPTSFTHQLENYLPLVPSDWQVLGVAGVTGSPRKNIGHILDRGREWGKELHKPVKVDTIDELLLITRGDIKFDPKFKQDFYGADICMGRNAYVIPCFVQHNSGRAIGGRTPEFYEADNLFRIKHADRLPVQTTCGIIQ